MKLSMWMIVERLNKYDLTYDITDGEARITGVRFLPGESDTFEPQYIYLGFESEMSAATTSREKVILMNGKDAIFLQHGDVSDILNDLLAVFDFYNTWEATLWEETRSESFQRVVDHGYSAFGNPILLADRGGRIIATDEAHSTAEVDSYWIEGSITNWIPMAIIGSPMWTAEGEVAHDLTQEPAEYHLQHGSKTIAMVLTVDEENMANLVVIEQDRAIMPGDFLLLKILGTALTSMLEVQKDDSALRSKVGIIKDLLGGTTIAPDLIGSFELNCPKPWRLAVIDNPFRSGPIYQEGVLHRIQDHPIPCVPVVYDDYVVVIASQDEITTILKSVFGLSEQAYFSIGVSLPFDAFNFVQARYRQALFTLNQAGRKPGIYDSTDEALNYLLSLVKNANDMQGLGHPALSQLKRYDKEKRADLYNTLYQYLVNERSFLEGSKVMHIHRNSFMHRVRKIKEILDVDLDDPMTRAYLMISYLME